MYQARLFVNVKRASWVMDFSVKVSGKNLINSVNAQQIIYQNHKEAVVVLCVGRQSSSEM